MLLRRSQSTSTPPAKGLGILFKDDKDSPVAVGPVARLGFGGLGGRNRSAPGDTEPLCMARANFGYQVEAVAIVGV